MHIKISIMDELESTLCEVGRLKSRCETLEAQRDELLEALEFLMRYPEEELAWQDAYAAIAKAKGGNDG